MNTMSERDCASDESWCNRFCLLLLGVELVIFLRVWEFLLGGWGNNGELLLSLATFLLSVSWLVMLLYINIANKVLFFFFRILISGIVNLVGFYAIFHFLGVAGAVIWVLGALLVNRSRLKIFFAYPNYIGYVVGGYVFSFMVNWLIGLLGTDPYSWWIAVGILPFLPSFVLLIWLWNLLTQEIHQGRSFFEAMRILELMPMTFCYFLIGVLTIVPIKLFSGESLFGEEGHDYLAMPQE